MTLLANHLCFQGHSFSSWPRCYGNFQPPPPPSPWTKDKQYKQYISVRSMSSPRCSFIFRKYCLSSCIQTERSFDVKKKNVRALTCNSLDRTTLLVSIGLGLKPFAWRVTKRCRFTVRHFDNKVSALIAFVNGLVCVFRLSVCYAQRLTTKSALCSR